MTVCIPANRGFRWNTRGIHSRRGLRLVIHNPMEGLESKFKPDTPELRDLNSAFFYESLITCQIIHTHSALSCYQVHKEYNNISTNDETASQTVCSYVVLKEESECNGSQMYTT